MSKYRIDFERHASTFKALANPHRLALFYRLSTCCPPGTACAADEAIRHNVGELGEGLEIAPSTLSHHLKELNRAGLVQMQRNGKHVECWVEAKILDELSTFFNIEHLDKSRSNG
jgi:ArsR family transcriptional regulator